MNQLIINPENGAVIEVPLNKLKPSPRNARKTPHVAANIEALAASIAAKGVIQPLVVEPERDPDGEGTGCFLVTVGEGRRQALKLRAKRKEIGKAFPVRCIVDTANDAFEVSLDENVTRFAMHPADQFEAFQRLVEERGMGPEEIGARFGVTPTVVRQRLRLAAVSPKLMEVYRAGDMTLDQLMVFTITADHARQEAAWESLSWNREPHYIRRCLTEDRVRASDRRAVFVGQDAYVEAGGLIERDLFADDYGGYFSDLALLDRLALEKLGRVADQVAGEGWKWVSATLEAPSAFQNGRVYPRRIDLSDEDRARYDAIGAEYDALCEAYDQGGDADGVLSAKLDELSEEREALEARQRVYDPEEIARSGAFVTLTSEGAVTIERGFVRREDAPPPDVDAEEDDEPLWDGEGTARHRTPRLSDKLAADLTAHRTAALCDRLGQSPDLALSALVHGLAVQTFAGGGAASCLELRAGSVHLPGYAPGIRQSRAGAAIEARHAEWASELPTDDEALWNAILAMEGDRRLALLAHCVGMTVNAIETTHRPHRDRTAADRLASALKLDMSDYWTPTTEGYLGRVTKALILTAVREGASEDVARRIEGLKKDALAESAEQALADKRWLPDLLRTEDVAGPAEPTPPSD